MTSTFDEYRDAVKVLHAAEQLFNQRVEEAKQQLQPAQERYTKALTALNLDIVKQAPLDDVPF